MLILRLAVLCSALSFAVQLVAQSNQENGQLQWAQRTDLLKGFDRVEVFSGLSDDAYLYSSKNTQAQLSHYSNQFEVKEQLQWKKPDKNLFLERVIRTEESLILAYSKTDRKAKQEWLFVQEHDPITLKPEGDLTKVGSFRFKGEPILNNFTFVLSPNKSRLLIYYVVPGLKKTSGKLGLHVLDAKGNELWSRVGLESQHIKKFIFLDALVDDNGHVMCLGKHYSQSSHKEDGPAYDYLVVQLSQAGKALAQQSLKVKGKYLIDGRLSLGSSGRLGCAGLYSSLADGSKSQGIFFKLLSLPDLKLLKETEGDFGPELVLQGESKASEKRILREMKKEGVAQIDDLVVDALLPTNDGEFWLVAESRYSVFDREFYSTTYKNFDIVIARISGTEIKWKAKISKAQVEDDFPVVTSYVMCEKEQELLFLYNGNESELKPDRDLKADLPRFGILASVSEAGKVAKRPLFSEKDKKMMIYTDSGNPAHGLLCTPKNKTQVFLLRLEP